MKLQIAIDGPASAGKSTVAKLVAKKLGYVYCDTGAMYRATTYAAKKNHVAYDDDQGLKEMLEKTEIRFVPAEPEQKVFVNETEVTKTIRLPEIANNVSTVSAQKSVRADLTERQRMIAEKGGIVMDGRDIGTTVLPNAEVKIFLVASVHERAVRRFKENVEKGIDTPLDVLEKEIEERDYKDSHRKISPLTQAKDAVLVDTTSLSIEEVVAKIMEIIEKVQK
ncbi:(d)CMP kinase [Ligilactobacillus ruminis]|uniref:Cytidylate kinase n=3 Tax=Ligilactobacillus ruminis TaxID=1623 RepID=G2SPD2_LIGR2|nr:(d)CMP kinase [Ligilactobacillus ruminis]AEN78445.1 cytidylate kinase [Ligilactobacillus ruminis ATCC 27782]KRM83673.1 cytidylate kinase [Ligilactobacillus ruminis DSM 20403 = NBRC 102161]KLA46090.1 cytidylate kinase [Ligilactobacillus ruminis]MCF2544539.1 (d)CMP kinase [Ligilactobacillus ruminis]SFG20154.1 cytidylate kinase [Ligilactobacillus ruminis DSM 20403 = NBRC 102161]